MTTTDKPRCEGCEDGDPLHADPVTRLRYHREQDPISGRTHDVVCTTDKPSIAELMRAHALYMERRNMLAAADLIDAAPVLLEIAQAALAANGPCDHPEGRCANGSHFRGCSRFAGERALNAALSKVRP